jgi:UDP-N-acetylglucosamine diphosphorylase / glucose-1-phosphate thymidylyltransferase / UDP-N-acetylgalactosamine diphosphorylase / glucosamine-1-phosphate N-acetyltransferase / galactosamine-1-phosphate N-acetyltransferase
MSGRRLLLVDPESPGPEWAPFAGARHLADLRAGAFLARDRWARATGLPLEGVWSPATAGYADVDSTPLAARTALVGPALVARSDVLPLGPVRLSAGCRGLAVDGVTVAWALEAGEAWPGPVHLPEAAPMQGHRLTGTADLVTASERLLADDCLALATGPGDGIPPGAVVLGDPALVAVRRASVEPHVVFDVRGGPVVLEADVIVRAGSRLEGPLYVGAGTWLLGGAIRQSAIGPCCRLHGEVAGSVFLGYANKSHEGFLGHSVVGQWVNLGAGTVTSNLKNTYGEVRLDLPAGRLPTGRTNLGTLFGDHAKTAIGTLLGAGTVVGAGAQVFGGPPPRHVRPFAWGGAGSALLDREGFVRIAGRVMPRRGVEVTPALTAALEALYGRLAR